MKKREAGKRYPKKVRAKKIKTDSIRSVCWLIIPIVVAGFMALDAFGIYIFTKERLFVLGGVLLVVLLPFFSEITIKELSVKRGKQKNGDDT